VENTTNHEIGEYHIVTTSVNPASSFNGIGNIVILTFRVTAIGKSNINRQSELGDHPLPENSSNLIQHTDTTDSIETTTMPEFPVITLLLLLIAAATALSAVYTKQNSQQ
jgi:hypothetical protein